MHDAGEPSVAIDLSRRKGRLVANRAVRDSFIEARRAAAPYVSSLRIALVRLGADRLARAGALVLACMALVAVVADVLASDLPLACRWHGVVYVLPNITRPAALAETDIVRMRREEVAGDWVIEPLVARGPAQRGEPGEALLPPLSSGHPMGTDSLGRDVFARVVHGTRAALGVGLGAAAVLVAVGVGLGAIAGFMGGVVDALVARAVEALIAIPTLILVLVVGALVPNPTATTLLLTIALTRWTDLARLVRAEVISSLGSDYVTAARALGAPPRRILLRHVLPNAIGPAIVGAAFAVAWVALLEATVDFLRVGSVDPAASWGAIMGDARAHSAAWWLVAFPGAALLAALVAANLVGEAARDALDPRLRGAPAISTGRASWARPAGRS
ncbi:MAG TPA: ABC transporter permease [Polyangiaceae bacterium]